MKIIEYSSFKELCNAAILFDKTVIATETSYSFRIFLKGKTKELHIFKADKKDDYKRTPAITR